MPWASSLVTNWTGLISTIGVIGGLLFSGHAMLENAKAQRASILFHLTEQHRELWMEMVSRPELARVLDADINLITTPVTKQEITYVKLLFLHLDSSYRTIKTRGFKEPTNLTLDIQSFLSLPIPRHVWTTTRQIRDPEFVAFVEKRLKNSPHNKG